MAYLVDLVKNLLRESIKQEICIKLLAILITDDYFISSTSGLIREVKDKARGAKKKKQASGVPCECRGGFGSRSPHPRCDRSNADSSLYSGRLVCRKNFVWGDENEGWL